MRDCDTASLPFEFGSLLRWNVTIRHTKSVHDLLSMSDREPRSSYKSVDQSPTIFSTPTWKCFFSSSGCRSSISGFSIDFPWFSGGCTGQTLVFPRMTRPQNKKGQLLPGTVRSNLAGEYIPGPAALRGVNCWTLGTMGGAPSQGWTFCTLLDSGVWKLRTLQIQTPSKSMSFPMVSERFRGSHHLPWWYRFPIISHHVPSFSIGFPIIFYWSCHFITSPDSRRPVWIPGLGPSQGVLMWSTSSDIICTSYL